MAAGDAQRAWFPDMLAELETYWRDDLDWVDVIDFCERMTELRSEIRTKQGIRPAMINCRSCGEKHPILLSPISPRSVLFALRKVDVISDEELKRLDKDWMRYRRKEDLDVAGHKVSDADDQRHESTCD